jgi:hypothetical protein
VIAILLGILFGDHVAAEWHVGDAEWEIADLAKKNPDNATGEEILRGAWVIAARWPSVPSTVAAGADAEPLW